MSKQDRQGVRTPADIERKYNLGQLNAAQGLSAELELTIKQLVQTVTQLTVATNAQFEALSNEIGKLLRRIERVEERIPADKNAILGYAQLGVMILGKGE